MADKIGTDEYGEILIYQTDDGQTNIEVKIEDDTVWLTQQQMSELFQTSRTNVVEHIKHIYEEGELDEISTCRNFQQVRKCKLQQFFCIKGGADVFLDFFYTQLL